MSKEWHSIERDAVNNYRFEWPADPAKRLRELEEWGVDLSLIDSSLARSPRERLDLMQDRLALIDALRRGRGDSALYP